MKRITPLVTAAALVLAMAVPVWGQVPVSPVPDSVKSPKDSAQKTLILSDAAAARDLLAQERRAGELADISVELATSEVRDFALSLQKQHAQHIVDLNTILEQLNRSQAGLAAGVVRDTASGFTDSAEVTSRHTSALQSLRGLSGKDFEKAWLDQEISMGEWRRDRLRQQTIPLISNTDLKKLADEIQTEVGVTLRKAQDLKAAMQ